MPAYATPLIGRDADCTRLRDLLTGHGHRLVSVTGIGGVGKTRLAVEVATGLQDQFRQGARFLSFASVPPTIDLDAAFAWHLGLRDAQHQSTRENIRQQLQSRHQLLVVDNVEHLPGIADLLLFVHATCAGIAIIATSRSELGVYGEVIQQLDPLPVCVPDSVLPGTTRNRVATGPAVRLFLDRVRTAAPDAVTGAGDTADVVAICEHLGGIPLALELTAPRLGNRRPAALRTELECSLDRANVLHDTMQLSYDMLAPGEQQVFRILSIMRGHWSVEDVLPLITPDIAEPEAIAIIDTLAARCLIHSSTGANEEVRFTLNPVLRQFGHTLLHERDDVRTIANRHATRMIALAETAAPEFTGGQQQAWLARIDALHEDFRLAHAWLLDHNRPVDSLRLSAALWRYSYTRGHFREIRAWIEGSLAATPDHDALRCRALNGIGMLANMTGDREGTRRAHEAALAIASRLQLHHDIALARIGLVDLDMEDEDNIERSLRHLDLAAAAYRQVDDARGLAAVMTNQGNIQWHSGDLDRACTTHEEARALYARVDDTRGMAWSDTNTGRIASLQGRYHDAILRLRNALDAYVALGDIFGVAEILEALAGVAIGTGQGETASVLAGAASTLRESTGIPLKGPDLAEFRATVRAAEASPAHDAAFARGCQLDPDAAIAIARAIPTPDTTAHGHPPDVERIAQDRFRITPREHQVLALLAEGLTDHEIADRLDLGRRTVQTYSASLARKLGASSRVATVRTAHQSGLMPESGTQGR